MYGSDMEEPKLPAAVYRRSVSLFPFLNNQQSLTSPTATATAQRNTAMNIFTYHTAGVWEREREGQCSTNYSLHPFGILLRDSQLPGNQKQGIGLTDPNTTSNATTAPILLLLPPLSKQNPQNSDPLALGLGVGIPPTRLVAASASSAADPTAKEIKGKRGCWRRCRPELHARRTMATITDLTLFGTYLTMRTNCLR